MKLKIGFEKGLFSKIWKTLAETVSLKAIGIGAAIRFSSDFIECRNTEQMTW